MVPFSSGAVDGGLKILLQRPAMAAFAVAIPAWCSPSAFA
jgi:hypothetical protein